jgi:hypothetical protein
VSYESGWLLAMSNTRKSRDSRRGSDSRRHESSRIERVSQADLRKRFAVVQAADAAEARGDAERAAAIMQSMPVGSDGKPFWRPWRVRRLAQLIELRDVMPRWAISRWILSQSLQQLDSDTRVRGQRALRIAIDVRGGEATLKGVDDIDALCKVIDHDWVYRQQYLYDLGGLRHFLSTAASADLVAGADRIDDWADAPMGGYRLQAVSPLSLRWEDLATGRPREVLNLGSAALVDVGEHVIGRLVPIEGGAMFESSPLPVPGEVAQRVAQHPDAWVDVLGLAVRECGAQSEVSVRALLSVATDPGLLTDVPEGVWRRAAAADLDRSEPLSQDPMAVIADAVRLFELIAKTATDDDAEMDRVWPFVAAALVVPRAAPLLSLRVGPGNLQSLRFVADRLTEPAATLCRGLAEVCREAS